MRASKSTMLALLSAIALAIGLVLWSGKPGHVVARRQGAVQQSLKNHGTIQRVLPPNLDFVQRKATIVPSSRRKTPISLPKLVAKVGPLLGGVSSAHAATASGDSPVDKLTGAMTTVQDMIVKPIFNPALDKAQEFVIQPVTNALSNPAVGELGLYLSKTVISWGVPATVLGLGLILASPKPKNEFDIESEDAGFSLNPFQKGRKKGEPKQYLKIERLNDKLESYKYSLKKATGSQRAALAEQQRAKFSKRYGSDILWNLDDGQVEKVVKADAKFRKASDAMQEQMKKITRELRALGAESASGSGDSSSPSMMKMMELNSKKKNLQTQQSLVMSKYFDAEQEYLRTISSELDEDSRKEFAKLLKRSDVGWQDGISGLSLSDNANKPPHVFVLNFPGDVTASQVKDLRQEVTAVIQSANTTRGDEVVLVLNTGGGTVTGYGLAAAQLIRLKNAGLKLNVCVEQVAASGGYMMACCADRLIASPFAVLGSIGVITQTPNVYDRLNREGVEFLTVTAGKYKRTLTPFKKATKEDIKKTEEDLEAIWTLFKDFVKEQRPKLNVSLVATGETWFGPDALERNLVDELKTTDDVLLELLDQGKEIYSVKYSDPRSSPLGQLLPATSDKGIRNVLATWLLGGQAVSAIADAGGLGDISNLQKRSMAIDRTGEETYLLDDEIF